MNQFLNAEQHNYQKKKKMNLPDPKDKNHHYQSNFPKLQDYHNVQQLRNTFAPLKNINTNQYDTNKAKFFIIKSTSYDNVHKAIKYGLWTSSPKNNTKLTKAFETQNPVYLVFSIVNSGYFQGIALMTSPFDKRVHCRQWEQSNKWFGSFSLEWLYIKDIEVHEFDHVLKDEDLEQNHQYFKDTQIGDVVDCTQIPIGAGIKILLIFKQYPAKTSLFDNFWYYDIREDFMRFHRENDPRDQQEFEEKRKLFEDDPSKFDPKKMDDESYFTAEELEQQMFYMALAIAQQQKVKVEKEHVISENQVTQGLEIDVEAALEQSKKLAEQTKQKKEKKKLVLRKDKEY